MSGWISGNIIKTPAFSVVAGEQLKIGLTLVADATCTNHNAGTLTYVPSCSVNSDFENTFGFSQSGPVFDLPAGWTANSDDGSIVNNMFVLTPEPSTALFLSAGIVGLAVRRRHARGASLG